MISWSMECQCALSLDGVQKISWLPLCTWLKSGKGQAQSAVARAMSSDPAVRAISFLTEAGICYCPQWKKNKSSHSTIISHIVTRWEHPTSPYATLEGGQQLAERLSLPLPLVYKGQEKWGDSIVHIPTFVCVGHSGASFLHELCCKWVDVCTSSSPLTVLKIFAETYCSEW